jgi:hypothetical protein
MKKKTKVEQIETEVTIYGCDFCDFESYDEEDVERHHGEMHAVKGKTTVEGIELYFFEKEDDADLWLGASFDYYDHVTLNWDSAGWYVVVYDEEPCSRGCCTRETTMLKFASQHANDLVSNIKNKMTHLEDELYKLNGFKKQIDALALKDSSDDAKKS